jgi:hypothetical protein
MKLFYLTNYLLNLLLYIASINGNKQKFLDNICINGNWINEKIKYEDYFPNEKKEKTEKWKVLTGLQYSCPEIIKVSDDKSCSFDFNNGNERIIEKKIWKSKSCEKVFPIDWIIELRNKRLVLVGDSVCSQIWQALICTILTATNGEIFYKQSTVTSPPRGSVFFNKYNITIDYHGLHYGIYNNIFLDKYAKLYDIIIYNFGLHYNKYPGKNDVTPDEQDFITHLRQVLLEYNKIGFNNKDSNKLYFMEVLHQHFPQMNNGYFAGGIGNETCSQFNDYKIAKEQDWRNIALDNVLSDIPIIRVSEGTKTEYESHFEGGDCTHYCHLSGVFSYILDVMYYSIRVEFI